MWNRWIVTIIHYFRCHLKRITPNVPPLFRSPKCRHSVLWWHSAPAKRNSNKVTSPKVLACSV